MRDGDALRTVGESAELFDDHAPLQRGAAGRCQGAAFTRVGRLQYRCAEGSGDEWRALFDSGGVQKPGWLREDNGRCVIAFDAPLEGAAPAAASLKGGASSTVNGHGWSVASTFRSSTWKTRPKATAVATRWPAGSARSARTTCRCRASARER